MYTNGLKDIYGKLLNCGVEAVKVTNNSTCINITPTISDDTLLTLDV